MDKKKLLKDFEGLDSKLNEYKEYRSTLKKRVAEITKETQEKEQELDKLLKGQVNDFMEGKDLANDEALALKNEVEYLKQRLTLILEAVKNDEKLKDLANEAWQEYKNLNRVMGAVRQDNSQKIKDLEVEYQKKVQDLQNEIRLQSNLFVNDYLEDRALLLEDLDLPRAEEIKLESSITRGLVG